MKNKSIVMKGIYCRYLSIIFFLFFSTILNLISHAQTIAEVKYHQVQNKLAIGWNTWNTQSVLSQVLLPQGLSVNIGFKNNGLSSNRYLQESYLSHKEIRPELIEAGFHAYDGSYTECNVSWEGLSAKVETATDGTDLVILVTPSQVPVISPNLVIEVGMIWNHFGNIRLNGQQINALVGDKTWAVKGTAQTIIDFVPVLGSYLSFKLDKQIGISVGSHRSLTKIIDLVRLKRQNFELSLAQQGDRRETYLIQQSALAWNMIYDPERRAVIAPVSRNWNKFFGGHYVLFDWDTYLAGLMAGFDNKYLAYANVVEVTKSVDKWGMVPNYVAAHNLGSPDRSQPPLGSLVVSDLYRRYQDKWLVELVFDRLLKWNRWWINNRRKDNYLCWGSNKVPPDGAAHTWQGAAYESGLDNSPMYDQIPFNKETGLMELADVGLMSIYIADCKALAGLADILQRKDEAREIRERAIVFSTSLQSLWHEEKGLFLNKRTDRDEWSFRLSPTLFYPLLAGVATTEQASRMVKEHLLNEQEFWGEWILPSIAKNDIAFAEQDYWRGRIWAPLNFLVYKGLKNYNFPFVISEFTTKSNQLLVKNWQESRGVYENYHVSGVGRLKNEPLTKSDNFYHWGALLGYIYLLENTPK